MQRPPLPPKPAIVKAQWDSLTVEHGRLDSVGKFDVAMPKHLISVSFLPHEQVTWSLDGEAAKTTSLPAGSVFFYGERQLTWHQRSKPSEYINLVLEPTLLHQVAAENGLSTAAQLETRVIFQDPTILYVAQLLRAEMIAGGLAGNLYVESLRNLLAVHLLRNHTPKLVQPTTQVPTFDRFKLKQLQDYIEENLAEDLTIATLAHLIPISQFYFARAFKAATGEPPHRYILRCRIERAKILLSVSALSVAEVAHQTGFSNQSHFTAQFRKVVGVTPRQFRDTA